MQAGTVGARTSPGVNVTDMPAVPAVSNEESRARQKGLPALRHLLRHACKLAAYAPRRPPAPPLLPTLTFPLRQHKPPPTPPDLTSLPAFQAATVHVSAVAAPAAVRFGGGHVCLLHLQRKLQSLGLGAKGQGLGDGGKDLGRRGRGRARWTRSAQLPPSRCLERGAAAAAFQAELQGLCRGL